MKLSFSLFLVCIVSHSYSQTFSLNDSNTIFKDSLGNILTSNQVSELAIKNSLSLSMAEEKDGKTIVVVKVSPRKTQAIRTENEWGTKWKGANLPDFELADIYGQVVKNADLKGKVVILNFWFTRCGPCIAEIPELNKLVEKYKDKNVVFLAPALDSKEEIEKFQEKHPFSYRILPNADAFAKSLEVKYYPVNGIVSQAGIITELISGASGSLFEHLDNKISILLKD